MNVCKSVASVVVEVVEESERNHFTSLDNNYYNFCCVYMLLIENSSQLYCGGRVDYRSGALVHPCIQGVN